MTAMQLLDMLTQLGVEVAAYPDRRGVWYAGPGEVLTREVAAVIDDHAAELQWIAPVRPPRLTRCLSCWEPTDAKGRCWRCGWRRCSGCHKNTGSAFIELCDPCSVAYWKERQETKE